MACWRSAPSESTRATTAGVAFRLAVVRFLLGETRMVAVCASSSTAMEMAAALPALRLAGGMMVDDELRWSTRA